MFRVTLSHVDTCLHCYLTDHHNREGEYLIGVPVDGATTNHAVFDAIDDEINRGANLLEGVTDNAIDVAIAKFFKDADMTALFDSSLEVIGEDEDTGDMVQAWFLLEWSEEE